MELFLKPPAFIGQPDAAHALKTRAFQGISSMAVSHGGTLWAVWYAGKTPAEDDNNYVVLACSQNKGKSWKELLIIDPDGEGPVRAFDPEVWVDPQNRLWVFWAQAIKHEGAIAGVWNIINPDADNSEKIQWTRPNRITNGIMMCKPVILAFGRWCLPVSTWRETDYSAKVIYSDDEGKSWDILGSCHVPPLYRNYDEHMLIEKRDGTLWMLVRTTYGIGESFSKDGGKTWSHLLPANISHVMSRFFIRRLQSGNLLLVKHGMINERLPKRSHLMAFISKDDGISWSDGLLIDERESISYPDGDQAKDGTIYITYDRGRTTDREILFFSIKEEDILNKRKNKIKIGLISKV